jgi:hypothetical protein
MSNASKTLNKVKSLLGLEVNLEQMKLENGTVLEAESFEAGESIFIVTEDEKVALPVGEYQLEDGRTLKVEEEGVIAAIGDEEEETEEVEETVEETEEELAEEEAKELEYVSKEEFVEALNEIVSMIEEVKAGSKEEMSQELATEVEETEEVETTEETVESEEAEELKAELSKPAAEPLKHNPEKVADQKEIVRFANKRPQTILDKVFSKLNNN